MLLHLGQNVITFRTLLHLEAFITFRPSTTSAIWSTFADLNSRFSLKLPDKLALSR